MAGEDDRRLRDASILGELQQFRTDYGPRLEDHENRVRLLEAQPCRRLEAHDVDEVRKLMSDGVLRRIIVLEELECIGITRDEVEFLRRIKGHYTHRRALVWATLGGTGSGLLLLGAQVVVAHWGGR